MEENGIHFYEEMEKPFPTLSILTFYAIYAMDIGNRITYVTPKLDTLTFFYVYLRITGY